MSPLIYEWKVLPVEEGQQRDIYINKQSHHPPSITKQIPSMIFHLILPIFHMIKRVLVKPPLTTITQLKTAVSTKTSNSHHDLLKEENAVETYYGLIRRWYPTCRPTLEKYFYNFLTNTSQNTINIKTCLIEIMLKSVIVVCRT